MLRPEDESTLIDLGYNLIKMKPSKTLLPPLASHIDLSLCIIKDKLFTTESFFNDNKEAFEKIITLGYSPCFVRSIPHDPYPYDVPLCVLNLGNKAILTCKRLTAPEIIRFCEHEGITVIDTKQGYAKCTALYMGGIITSDKGILRTLEAHSFKALEILEGGIELPPYKHGFIGGSCGFDGEKILVSGSLSSHPSATSIIEFSSLYSIKCVSLSNSPILDIGSMLFI